MHALRHAAMASCIAPPASIQALAVELGVSVDALVRAALGSADAPEITAPELGPELAARARKAFRERFPGAAEKLAHVWPWDCPACRATGRGPWTTCSKCGLARCPECVERPCPGCERVAAARTERERAAAHAKAVEAAAARAKAHAGAAAAAAAKSDADDERAAREAG